MYSWPPNYKPPTEDGEERCEDKEEDAVEMKALESRVYRKDQVTFINGGLCDVITLHVTSNINVSLEATGDKNSPTNAAQSETLLTKFQFKKKFKFKDSTY